MKGYKTISKSDKDYVYDSLIDAQGIIDDLVEYMEDDETYEEDDNKRDIWEEIIEFVLLFWGWALAWIMLQATFTLLPNV